VNELDTASRRRSRAGSGSFICGGVCIVNGRRDPAHGLAVLVVVGYVGGREAHEMVATHSTKVLLSKPG
jgi:hypothetical protein